MREILSEINNEKKFGIYIHVPFCATRCGYCDFNTYTPSELNNSQANENWLHSLLLEVDSSLESLAGQNKVHSIFFGGGTPSLLSEDIFESIFNKLTAKFKFSTDIEITIEANPDTVTAKNVKKWTDLGVNRISLGMQSADKAVLSFLERTHNPSNVSNAVELIREGGIDNFSLDLIYGSVGETLESWQKTLTTALTLAPPHISAYALTIEPGTSLARKMKSQQIAPINSDDQADKYLLMDKMFRDFGLNWYEISNWSKPGFECKHNLIYWTNQNWWGYGPGAHSHLNGVRWWNVKHPTNYSKKLKDEMNAVAEKEVLNPTQQKLEDLMLKLRIRETDLTKLVPNVLLQQWRANQLTTTASTQEELTPKGRLLLDSLIHQVDAVDPF